MRRIVRLAGATVVVVALAGCWPQPGQNADRTAHNALETRITPETVGGLTEAWAAAVGPSTAPVVSARGVHVVVGTCGIATLDLATGAPRWGVPCDPYAGFTQQASAPYAFGDDVAFGYWGTYDSPGPTPPQEFAFAHRYDAATGEDVSADPPGVGGTIPASRRGGVEMWTSPYHVYSPVPPYPVPILTISLANAQLSLPGDGSTGGRWIGTGGGGVPTLGASVVLQTGSGRLSTDPADPAEGLGVRAYLRSAAGASCPHRHMGSVECPHWVAPTDGAPTGAVLAPDQATVYVGTGAGSVYALDATTGAVRWTAALGAAVTAEPALADGTLFVPTADGRVVALDAAGCGAPTCAAAWTATTGARVTGQPAVAGGVLFAGSDDGSVDAFDAAGCGEATCPPLWSADTGGAIQGGPVVSNGRVFVAAGSRVVAYR